MPTRTIVQINEDLCTGCGDCIPNCAEGALQIIDGKARLVSDILCDGFGACLGHCPEDAITMIQREAEEFSAEAVDQFLRGGNLNGVKEEVVDGSTTSRSGAATASFKHHALGDHPPVPNVCPGSMSRSFVHGSERRPAAPSAGRANRQVGSNPDMNVRGNGTTQLATWPIQLHLLSPDAPFLAGSDLLLCADCVPFAYPGIHGDFMRGHTLAIGCPKLDDVTPYLDKLALIFRRGINSLTVLHMEVPCCGGLVNLAARALQQAQVQVPVRVVTVSIRGEILQDRTVEA